jgi:hypothetical protein
MVADSPAVGMTTIAFICECGSILKVRPYPATVYNTYTEERVDIQTPKLYCPEPACKWYRHLIEPIRFPTVAVPFKA